MKKIIIGLILLLIMSISLLYYIFIKSELKMGYYYVNSEHSYLEIYEAGTFSFVPSVLMSQSYTGKYRIEGNTLVLASDIGTFKFKILDKKLKYIEGKGDFIGDLVEPGTIYEWEAHMPFQ